MSERITSQERHDMEKWSKGAWAELRCACEIANSQYITDDNGRCYFCGRQLNT